MKKQITRAFAIIIAAVILGAAPLVSAQTAERLVINVPFDFVAGGEQFPAGRYVVRRVTPDNERALFIQSEDGRVTATLLTNSSGAPGDAAKLLFRQYGDRYFLAGVRLAGAAGGREVPESKQERDARRERAAKAGGEREPKTVAVNVQ